MDELKKSPVEETSTSIDYGVSEAGPVIYIDPAKEAACRKKFDTYLVPISVIYLVLSTLDRNNIGNARVFGFDESLGLHGNQFGNIITLSSVCTVVFEVPWVMSVKRCGARNAIGTAFVLWSACTIGTAFIHTYGQPIAVRMLLNAAEAGLAQGFAFLFSQIYPPTLAGKRIMTTNIAQCISGAFGGLFAYAFQTTGARNGLEAWRWLFIIEFLITHCRHLWCWIVLPSQYT
ncbi:uncharacterized protein MYCGRDRAFT_89155 [Zymoseptoria tritici IPO323]|uniref:Major facilitator superfamily (MFS) profile domain-containing protein n=1 Tax=Zymoseptoria tritici (strain CBS 115943 / IPO323) TaxID=336722 RepID=F9WZ40_ZYMTI|nr:uncharacterized protein MYCGRDRAFT_89155 [Zymoseptoria tritici IPO323]EGP91125.1 hypothetical protein MYCGRDRAFT_89155 [Zymoseptoria tritici IPO323]